ncbi:MAG TPA: hypothetical protein VIJ64_03005, partial [Candidatus Lustribacter sp.]
MAGIASDTPAPARISGAIRRAYGTSGATSREPRHTATLQREARDHQRAFADPVDQRSGQRREDEERRRPRQEPHARIEWARVLRRLQELRQEKQRAVDRRVEQHACRVSDGERTRCEQPQRNHRFARSPFPADERRDEHAAPAERWEGGEIRPTMTSRTHQTPHEPERAGRRQCEPDEVEARCFRRALVDPSEDQRNRRQTERHVDPENRVPREGLHERAAEQRPADQREAGEGSEEPERATALGRRIRQAQQRDRERENERAAHALDRARDDQRSDIRGERARRRCRDEERDTADEDAPASEAFAERGA